MPWVFDPQSGGRKVPPREQEETRQRILRLRGQALQGQVHAA
jgi:hypothetical protein